MARPRKIIATGTAASALLLVMGGSAGAETQYVEATVGSGVSVAVDTPVATASTFSPGSVATIPGGTLTVNANADYEVSITFDKGVMTEWDTAGGDYVAVSPETLAQPITLTATPSAELEGAGVGVGTATSGSGGVLAGVSLLGLGGDASYALTYAQPIGFTDAPGTYRIRTTFTGSSVL